MVGMATIRDETMNGARKDPLAVISNMDFLSEGAAIAITSIVSNPINKRLISIKILALPMPAIYALKIAKQTEYPRCLFRIMAPRFFLMADSR